MSFLFGKGFRALSREQEKERTRISTEKKKKKECVLPDCEKSYSHNEREEREEKKGPASYER